ncbi:MAG: MinD/ParA family protein [Zoogloeaceae bacterium]|nr:MinD/ParA family protein [Zoogloeaceae bacterium]
MADSLDQAAGLRRLFASRQLRAVTFASGSPGAGRTTLLANVAVELARQGQEVLVVDENGGRNLGAFFGTRPPGDLLQVLHRKRALEDILYSPFPGVRILAAGRAARQLTHLAVSEQQALMDGINTLSRPVDALLVDSSPDHAEGFSPLGLAGEAVMVVAGSRKSITDSYALIRKISQSSVRRHFRILVNRVKNAEEGQVIFGNLKKVAAQRGVARLEYGGAIPADDTLKRLGELCQPVVEALPDNPASVALRDFASRLYSWPEAEFGNGGVEQFVAQLLHFTSITTPHVLHA